MNKMNKIGFTILTVFAFLTISCSCQNFFWSHTGSQDTGISWDIIGIGDIYYSLSVVAQDDYGYDVDISNDGYKVYLAGYGNKTIFQYNLTTPFDLSTASYGGEFLDVSSNETQLRGIEFVNEGYTLFILGTSTTSVFKYTLTTAYDVTTASYANNTVSVGAQAGLPYGVSFNSDGTLMIISDRNSSHIYQYSLSSSYDLSTASYDNVSIDTGYTLFQAWFSPDGNYLFWKSFNILIKTTLSTAFDITSGGTPLEMPYTTNSNANAIGFCISPNAEWFYATDYSNDRINQYPITIE